MPTYGYMCSSCNGRFDFYQGIKDDPLEECPDCNGMIKRLITGGLGFMTKGGDTSFGDSSCSGGSSCNSCTKCGK